ncbi:hypothetical protein GCM10007358_11790 [Phocicoccus schoeneichii]|uniref:Molybdate-binding periplasmic protein n=1 Tax=Phocicoccus schoeneichii TaxID=1812261 RepID=A0A6V7RBQ0_9BACL|nr:molybdate ABC transporter substrate-binding protein [Jeotgalicoccus schoeneichii]GGH52939.1 hypothetical protein GCM10007358_11790 [Jeotgalicoccus schoeneichii]CAD2074192.1 Molybdate-binding periplasmic protein precursor [Jeotgalicoccus schoeneichii]
MSRFQMTKRIGVLIVMSLSLILAACGGKEEPKKTEKKEPETEAVEESKEPEVVKIYIKENLEEAFNEIVNNFEREYEDIDIEPVFLTNEEIVQRVKEDEESSVVFTTENAVKELIEDDIVNIKDTKFLMMDELILFTKSEDPGVDRVKDMDQSTRVAILNPENYEEGELSKNIFEDEEFENVNDENFVIGDSAEDVIQDVMNNNAQVGVLYQSTIANNEELKTLVRAPRRVVEPFIYQLGLVSKAEVTDAERKVYDYLLSQDAQDILKKYGFVV